MNKVKVTILGLLALLFSGSFIMNQPVADAKVYLMTGNIRVINQGHNTVVIEVPMGSQMFTVGGPLSENAVLKMKEKPAKLSDFTVGQTVNVKWQSTERGHLILNMESK